MSGYGGNASFGVGLYAVGVFGTFGSGKALHQATVTITRNGEVASQYTMTSGNMTNEEAALGFPRSSLATHTEARAVKQIPMLSGDTMIIMGQYPPCPSCKGAMNVAARVNGTIIIYRWPGENGQLRNEVQ
ncbi:MAG: hypothetical protein IPM84_03735 [Anaerolineae bacterium]|nr:hypothetical protein [Anaerolineae bacterium]